MNLSDWQNVYHKLLVFQMDFVKIRDVILNADLRLSQIDLLLAVINILIKRLYVVKNYLEKRRIGFNEKKIEQTLF